MALGLRTLQNGRLGTNEMQTNIRNRHFVKTLWCQLLVVGGALGTYGCAACANYSLRIQRRERARLEL